MWSSGKSARSGGIRPALRRRVRRVHRLDRCVRVVALLQAQRWQRVHWPSASLQQAFSKPSASLLTSAGPLPRTCGSRRRPRAASADRTGRARSFLQAHDPVAGPSPGLNRCSALLCATMLRDFQRDRSIPFVLLDIVRVANDYAFGGSSQQASC